ncbi:MAG TPA: CHASE2 domain-containing protein [Candidatus Sulfomarinibacteraceae bacterium]|nr:CHASE2 domain-containing protein [Candidatus Sulfomarinibacteraceae bacterium]
MPGADHPLRRPLRAVWAGKGVLVGVGLGLTVALALLLVFEPTPVRLAELRTYDLMLGARRAPPPSPALVLVGIDDESLAARGQWPWPRYRLAMLVERLQRAGAEVVALDLLMPEPDRTSPEIIRTERERDAVAAVAPESSGVQDGNTERLATALRRGNTVLAYHLAFSGGGVPAEQPVPTVPAGMIVTGSPGSADGWPEPTGAIRSLPQLTAASTAEGFANSVKDVDGTLRRTPLLLTLDDRPLPSLALAAILMASTERNVRRVKEGSETFLHWGTRRIPLDRAGNMLLDIRSEQRARYHSARAVLDGELGTDGLRGKIVLVGGWATGTGDLHLVPSGRWARGLEVHASVIDAILTGRFIARPGWARGAELVAVLLLGIASTLLLSRSGFKLSLAAVSLGSVGCYWGATQLLAATGLYLSPLMPMATPVVITTVLSLLKYGIEARKVEEGLRSLLDAQDAIIVSMSVLSEARDEETGRHILRTQRYVEILARQLATTPRYRDLGEPSIRLLAKSAPLHDIGKVGIPDEILQKPGKLSADEYAVMKSHTTIGANALTQIVDAYGHPEDNEFLTYARQMTVAHHERWDGSGYPAGLRGEDIPLAGRLMAVADVYDAMVSRRVYKAACTHEDAREYIRQQSGAYFDPDVVAAFLARHEAFQEVARTFSDGEDSESAQRAEAATP